MSKAPHFVAIGGTSRPDSSTERALRRALDFAGDAGATTALISGEALSLPFYEPGAAERGERAAALVAQLRRADALVIGSPGYHGGLSGLVKNALDYVEDLRGDARSYLDGVPVGCVATAAGWQGAMATLIQIRSVVHALRGWPTPLGVAINTAGGTAPADDPIARETVQGQLKTMVAQQLSFLRV